MELSEVSADNLLAEPSHTTP